jgi:hypothetical protein
MLAILLAVAVVNLEVSPALLLAADTSLVVSVVDLEVSPAMRVAGDTSSKWMEDTR